MRPMTPSALFTIVLIWALGVTAHVRPRNQLNARATEAALSACVQSCFGSVLKSHSCAANDACFCVDDTIKTELRECVSANCTAADSLAVYKFQADTCEYPNRSHVQMTTAVVSVLFALAIVFSIARFLGRSPYLNGAGFWWDDTAFLITLLPTIGVTVAEFLDLQHGMGKDIWRLTLPQVEESLKIFFAGQPLYVAVLYGTKLSLVLLYIRIWSGDARVFRNICWGVVGVLATSLVIFEFTTILQCVPVKKNWTSPKEHPGFCSNRKALIFANAAINIVYDLLVLGLPIRSLSKLDVPPLKKTCIFGVFLIGGVVTICSIVRMTYLGKYADPQDPNVTWTYNYIGLWSMIEVYLSIIWCCMPATAGLLHRAALKVRQRRKGDIDIANIPSSHGANMSNEMVMTRAEDGRTLQASPKVLHFGAQVDDLEAGKKSSSSEEEDGGVPYVPGESENNMTDPEKRLTGQSLLSQTTSIDGKHERSSSSPPKVQEQEQARAATARQVAEQILTTPAVLHDPTNERASFYKDEIEDHPQSRPTSTGEVGSITMPERAVMPSRHAHSYIAYKERPRYSQDTAAAGEPSRAREEQRREEAMSALQYAFHRNATANARSSDSTISRGRSRGISNERPRLADSGEHPLLSNGVTAAFQEKDHPREDSLPVPETATLQKEDSTGSNKSDNHDSAYGSNSSGNNSKRASPLDGSGKPEAVAEEDGTSKGLEAAVEDSAQTVMVVRPDPPRLIEGSTAADAEQLLRAQGGFSSGNQGEAHDNYHKDAETRPLHSLERRATTGSLKGSVHSHVSACFDSIPTTPMVPDLAPEEAMHRADMKEFAQWRPFQLEAVEFAAKEPDSPNMVKAAELPKAKAPLYYFDEYGIQRPHPSQKAAAQEASKRSSRNRMSSPGNGTPYEGPTAGEGWKQAAETSATSAALDGAGKVTSFIDRLPTPPPMGDISAEQAAFHDEATTPDERGIRAREDHLEPKQEPRSSTKDSEQTSAQADHPRTPDRQQARMSTEEVWMKPREDQHRQSREEDPLVSKDWSKPHEEEQKWSPVEVSRATTQDDNRVPTLKEVRSNNGLQDESNVSTTDYTTADELQSTPEDEVEEYRRRRRNERADQPSSQFTFSAGPRPATADGDHRPSLDSSSSRTTESQHSQNDAFAPPFIPNRTSSATKPAEPSSLPPRASSRAGSSRDHNQLTPTIATRSVNPPPPPPPIFHTPSIDSARSGPDTSDFPLPSNNNNNFSQGSEEDYYRRRATAMNKLRAIIANDHDDYIAQRARNMGGNGSGFASSSSESLAMAKRNVYGDGSKRESLRERFVEGERDGRVGGRDGNEGADGEFGGV